jgi:hypothetical protein
MKIRFVFLAILLCGFPHVQAGQIQSGGATNVQAQGAGFGCANGGTWKMDNGVARCFLPLAAAVVGAPCAAIA